MAVAFDANSTANSAVTVSGTTGVSHTALTVGSGANRALVVQICFSDTVSAVAVTWDSGGTNQAMTKIVSAAAASGTLGEAHLWGLVNPISGNKTLKVTWNAVTRGTYVNGTSFTGADQTGGVTTFPHSTSLTGSLVSSIGVAVTSAVGNQTVACGTLVGGDSWVSTSQTSTFIDNSLAEDGMGSRGAGAATVTHTLTASGAASQLVGVGTDILAIASATDTQEWMPRQAAQRGPRWVNQGY